MSPGPRDGSMLKHMLTVAGRQAAAASVGGGGGGGGGVPNAHGTANATNENTLDGRGSLAGAGGTSAHIPSSATLPHLPHHHHHHHHHHPNAAAAAAANNTSNTGSSSSSSGNHHPHHPPPNHHHHHHHHPTTPPTTLSVKVNGAAGGRHHPALNMSSLSSSKHSVGGNSGSVSPGTTTVTRTTGLDQSRDHSHLTDLSHISHLSPIQPVDISKVSKRSAGLIPRFITLTRSNGSRGALTSLGLLCLISLLLALLALTFLVELTPLAPDADSVQEVTLALAALTLSLDLSCLLICAAQFIFAIKLAKSPNGEERMSKYLRQSSVSRVCAVGGFFVSVPVFLTGVILYTFIHFQSTPAILTSVFIGVGIIFCGCAMIHNVFIWQKCKMEKTKAVAQQNIQQAVNQEARLRELNTSPLPNATLDLSGTTPPHELSTLV